MLILTPQQQYSFHGRENSPSDGPVVRETWVENVYRVNPADVDDTRIVVDVGANIGAFSVFAASMGGNVIAAEPEPDNVTLLRRNLQHNRFPGNYRIYEAAVTDRDGHVHVSPAHGDTKVADDGVRVRSVTLETLFVEHSIRYCDVLKIDVEGSEYPLIAAAPIELLDRCRYITLEFDAADDATFGALVAKLAHKFSIDIIGSPARGGYIYARRYD